MATIKDLYDWINLHRAGPGTELLFDGHGNLSGVKTDGTALSPLAIGFGGNDSEGDPIDGRPGQCGEIVFWHGRNPWWIVEWQPSNGHVFAVVDAAGNIGVAGADELTRDFRNAGGE